MLLLIYFSLFNKNLYFTSFFILISISFCLIFFLKFLFTNILIIKKIFKIISFLRLLFYLPITIFLSFLDFFLKLFIYFVIYKYTIKNNKNKKN